ncbi:MAG: molybdopterin molybdotransferase MoeA [Anaerolineales bacterium]|nr:molybdopterin molybdotransferase MoeA [Anaerolineales bacterium]
MLTVAEARARILEHFRPLDTEVVALEAARGRVLAEAIYAGENLPPFPNSSMDGYAVRVADTAHATPDAPVTLPISGDIPAGAPLPGELPPGTAMRIMTGAPVPGGADAVVPVEETDDGRNHAHHSERTALPAQIRIFKAPRPGANIRPVGQDVSVGQQVLAPGVRLRPAALGVLAALGHAQVRVYRRPRVALLSTGDELVGVTDTPRPGQIRDINSITLAAAIEQYGGEPLRLGVAPDRLDEVRRRLQQAVAHGANLILSSAGVSVGVYDVVKGALEADGALTFWKVNMRPGKPLAFGHVGGVPFIGLPGNPVSALVGFEVFVRPALLRLAGQTALERFTVLAELAEPVHSDGRETYLRVTLEQRGERFIAHSTGLQGSNIITSLVKADGLLIIPAGVTQVAAGSTLPVWLLDAF